jgi:hypothetical protein
MPPKIKYTASSLFMYLYRENTLRVNSGHIQIDEDKTRPTIPPMEMAQRNFKQHWKDGTFLL